MPTVNTCLATQVTENSALLHGVISFAILQAVPNYRAGIQWRRAGTDPWTFAETATLELEYSVPAAGLNPGTIYQYQAIVKDLGEVLLSGEIKTFTTSGAVAPTVTTNAATNVYADRATLNGTVTSDGGGTPNRYFKMGTSPSNLSSTLNVSEGEFSMVVTGLFRHTTYYFSAFAANGGLVGQGDILSFKTVLPLVMETGEATDITDTSATLHGELFNSDPPHDNPPRIMHWRQASVGATWNSANATNGEGAYSVAITGLLPNTTYEYRAVHPDGSWHYGQVRTFVTNGPAPTAPTVTTNAATNVSQTSATLNGTVTNNGNGTPTRYFMWGTSSSALNTRADVSGGVFNKTLSGLAPGTKYYFRAFAANGELVGHGGILSFTTAAPTIVSPTVITLSAIEITLNSAKLRGRVTDTGGGPATHVFFWDVWDPNPTQVLSTEVIVGTSGLGDFECTLTGLTPGTEYAFGAGAMNGGQLNKMGDTLHFTTATPVTVKTGAVSDQTSNSAKLHGAVIDGTPPISGIQKGIQWRMALTSNWTSIAGPNGTGTYSVSVTGLLPNTAYEYRAYAFAGDHTYGEIKTFSTGAPPLNAPIVVTKPANSITHNSANLRGEVTDAGNGTPLRSFEYGLQSGSTTITVDCGTGSVGGFERSVVLESNKTYKFRAVASNGTPAYGEWRNFTTIRASNDGIWVNIAGSLKTVK